MIESTNIEVENREERKVILEYTTKSFDKDDMLYKFLQVPLARFIARCVSHYGLNGLSSMKCYQIGSVYREGVTEMHPRDLTECGYDIIFTQST